MRLCFALFLAPLACYVGAPRYTQSPERPPPPAVRASPPPPGAPAGRMLSEQEAVSVALGYARSQRLGVSRVKHSHLDGAGRWHVELWGERGHDRARILVDGWTGQVLRASLKDEEGDGED